MDPAPVDQEPVDREPVDPEPVDQERVTAFVRGQVQGVGFRWWTRSRALGLGLRGWARNLPDGRVEVLAQGGAAAVERLLVLLEEDPSTTGRPGRVDGVTAHRLPPVAVPATFEER